MRATFLSGTEVTVRVANSALQEYDVDDSSLETAKTAAAYIEAVPGANFVIEVKLAPSFPYTKDCVECQLYIDGNWVCGELIDLTKVKSRGRTLHLDGCEENINGGAVLRRFTFAEHQASKYGGSGGGVGATNHNPQPTEPPEARARTSSPSWARSRSSSLDVA